MDHIKRAWRAAKAAHEAHGFFTSELARLWLYPVLGTALTVLSGFFSQVPVPYLLAAASFVFAAVATAMLRLEERRERIDPSGKVVFEHPLFVVEVAAKAEPAMLVGVQLGIVLRNAAAFSIHYEVEAIDTRFMNRVAETREIKNRGGEISPNTTAWFRDNPIEIGVAVSDARQTGRVKFRVAYWRTPERKFFLDRVVRIDSVIDPQDGSVRHSWVYE